MKLTRASLLLAAFALGLAACSNPTAPTDSLPPDAATTSSAPAKQGAESSSIGTGSNELADFTVEPGQVFSCDGRDRTISKVKWSVKDPAVATVKVLVGDKESGERKIFTAGGNIGEEVTGNWVVAGTHFSLVDGKTDKELASYEVPALPCN